jgi:hypothetical protein
MIVLPGALMHAPLTGRAPGHRRHAFPHRQCSFGTSGQKRVNKLCAEVCSIIAEIDCSRDEFGGLDPGLTVELAGLLSKT